MQNPNTNLYAKYATNQAKKQPQPPGMSNNSSKVKEFSEQSANLIHNAEQLTSGQKQTRVVNKHIANFSNMSEKSSIMGDYGGTHTHSKKQPQAPTIET